MNRSGGIKNQLYRLDRTILLSRFLLPLSRLEGNGQRGWKSWLNRIAKSARANSLHRLRISDRSSQLGVQPYLTADVSTQPRSGIFALLTEWLEFRRTQPIQSPIRLVIAVESTLDERDLQFWILKIWEQVRAMSRRMKLKSCNIDLAINLQGTIKRAIQFASIGWIHVGDRPLDPANTALIDNKQSIVPDWYAVSERLAGNEIRYRTRRSVMRFFGEARTAENASRAIPIPEIGSIAASISRLIKQIDCIES